MFPNHQIPYSQYFYLPPYSSPYSPYLMPNYLRFGNPALPPQFSQFQVNHQQQSIKRTQVRAPTPQIRQKVENKPQVQLFRRQMVTQLPNTQDKKAKKPSNRPATYLTQRKYYLAQELPQQDTLGVRTLRPRHKKKKHIKKYKSNQGQTELKRSSEPVSKQAKVIGLKEERQVVQAENDSSDNSKVDAKALENEFFKSQQEINLGGPRQGEKEAYVKD